MKESAFVACFTNTVAANITANALLAVGAKPAMIEEPSEAREIAAVADALLVNVGTLTADQERVMHAAIDIASARHIPWVLDPVAAHVLTFRQRAVWSFVDARPTLIRGNHDEIDYLRRFPEQLGATPLLSTGAEDRLYACANAAPTIIAGGVAMLQRVTATGCAQGAVLAASLGRGFAPLDAARAVSRLFKRAGERAYAKASAPGSFQIAFLDALYDLTHEEVRV